MSKRAYRATRVNDVNWDQLAQGKEGLQVTRRRLGRGRPSVAEDGRVRRPCSNQRNKSERKENTRQPQLCSMPGHGSSSTRAGEVSAATKLMNVR
jgi:hypothetical protein